MSKRKRKVALAEIDGDKVARQNLRTQLREKDEYVARERLTLMRPGKQQREALTQVVEQEDAIMSSVTSVGAQELVYDSQFLRSIAEIAMENANRIEASVRPTPGSVVAAVKDLLQKQVHEDNVDQFEDPERERWHRMGHIVVQGYLNCVAGPSFLAGAIPAEQKPIKERTKPEPTDKIGKKEVVTEDAPGDTVKDSSGWKNQIRRTRKFIEEKKEVAFWPLSVHPGNMGKTVERVFHLAFLVKEGAMGIKELDNGPNVYPMQPPSRGEVVKKQQAILKIDKHGMQFLQGLYNIQEPMLPDDDDDER